MSDLQTAVKILRSGGLIAFATETVYGLGADATSSDAVRRVFAAKGRPTTNPLIVHVADAQVAQRYATLWPPEAQKLASQFWPGPLTLVLPKRPIIVDEVTAGLPSVGLRVPDHPRTLQLLREFDGPVTGPSANRSNQLSPTTAAHVRQSLGNAVDLILDGGPCRVGIESTVLDLSRGPGRRPVILRPGGITRQQIESIIGPVEVFNGAVNPSTPAAGPGMQAVHYAPRAAAYRFEASQVSQVEAWCQEHSAEPWTVLRLETAPSPGLMERAGRAAGRWLDMPRDAADYARCLYDLLHLLDDQGIAVIWIEIPPDGNQWAAVRDRLQRATRPAGFS